MESLNWKVLSVLEEHSVSTDYLPVFFEFVFYNLWLGIVVIKKFISYKGIQSGHFTLRIITI